MSKSAPTAVWLSIDKDVLPESQALTNWDQGQMPLAAVVQVIEVGARVNVLSVPRYLGEFSPPRHRNLFKRWEACDGSAAARGAEWGVAGCVTNKRTGSCWWR